MAPGKRLFNVQAKPAEVSKNNQKDTSTKTKREKLNVFRHATTGGAFDRFAVLAAGSSGALAQKKYDTGGHRHRNQDRQHHALQRTCVCLGVIGKNRRGYFRKINAAAASTAARSTSFPMTTPTAAESREQARKLVESDEALNRI